MPNDTALVGTLAAGLGVAFVLGLLAVRLKLPPIVGYLAAGVVLRPLTPAQMDDRGLARVFAELGVVLLMFGVGLHFSLGDLARVRRVAVPAAILQTAITGTLGVALAHFWGWGWGGAAVLGLALGVASTVVLVKALEQRDRLDSPEGRLAVGWLVVEDVAMVFALVLLPAIAPVLSGEAGASAVSARTLALSAAAAAGKVALFIALMFFVGRRFVPWLLAQVARLGSRELFTLAVLATALGVGTVAAKLFGVTFALGAFFAGAVVSESELSHRAAADALPMQDAFAVVFFVSVGMLFDPTIVTAHPGRVLTLVATIVLWKSALAFALLRALGESPRIAMTVGAAIGQIGEFSFIVAGLGVTLGLIERDAQALIVVAALTAITLNGPVLSATTRLLDQFVAGRSSPAALAATLRRTRELRAVELARSTAPGAATAAALDEAGSDPYDFSGFAGHVVVIGYGRVGSTVADALTRAGAAHVVVEEQERVVGGLRLRGERAIQGDATRADVLERSGVAGARLLVVTAPEPIRARRIVEVARAANPHLTVAVRTHSSVEQAFFEKLLAAPGASGRAVYAEREAALSLAHYALLALGGTDDDADRVVESLRGHATAPTEMFEALPTQEYQALTRRTPPAGAAATSPAAPDAKARGA